MRPGDECLVENLDSIDGIVKAYAPTLHFHHREGDFCCYPSDAQEVYREFGADWSAFTRDLTPDILDPQAPCYFEAWQDDNMLQIRYWFWYRFNRFPGGVFGLGDHLGDWEHVEIRLYGHPEDGPKVWLLSNHLAARLSSFPSSVSLPGFEPEDSTFTVNRVHVWVALGSHANYPSPNSRPYCYAHVFCDQLTGGGETWDTGANLVPLHSTNFAVFTGRWGDKKAPRSPTNNYNNRWRSAPDIMPIV